MPNAMLVNGLEAGQVGVWSWDKASDRVQWSPNLEDLHGLSPGSFDGSFSFFQTDIHPDDRDRVLSAIEAALARGGSYRIEYRLPEKPGRETRWLEARGEVHMEYGSAVGMTGICQDITARKAIEIELERHARQQAVIVRLGELVLKEAPLQALFDTVANEVASVLDVEFCKLLELQPGGKLLLRAGVGWNDGLVGHAYVPMEVASAAGYTLKVEHAVVFEDLATETRFSGPGLLHDHGIVSGMSVIIAGEAGEAFGVLGAHSKTYRRFTPSELDFLQSVANIVATGIQRHAASDRQTLLLRELRHRVGNLLALILSLFSNTARSAVSTHELAQKFEARLLSLSRVHGMISDRGWGATELKMLVQLVLEPYLDRVTFEGRDVKLSAEAGFYLSLALHELATNAIKYGALSVPEGRIALRWSSQDKGGDSIALEWVETGGPAVQPPTSRGFGSKLVDALVRRQIRGDVTADFDASGLRVRVILPFGTRADAAEPAYELRA